MNLYKLGNIPEELYPSIGGKAKGIDMLIKHGYHVPKGFLITDLDDGIVEEEIYKLFDELGLDKVSVRSSASNEDGEKASNAGQFETYLFVNREELISSIKKCNDSLNSLRANSYANHFDIKCDNHMNIVIQEMIDSHVAGVMFTTDPLHVDKVLIEAVEGQGENLVSGKVSARQYLISKFGFDVEGDDLLNKENLEKLYEVSSKIKKDFAFEADIEWAINGGLYLLQIRPITVKIPDICEFDREDDLSNRLFTKRNVGEMMPGAVTPLTLSTSAYAIDYGMRYMLAFSHAYKKIDDVKPLRLISSFANHLFFDMSLLYEMHNKVGIADPQAMNLSIMGEYHNYPPVLGKKSNFIVRGFNSLKFLTFVFSGNKAKKKLDNLLNRVKFISDDSCYQEIYDDISNKIKYLNECLIYHYQASSYSGSSISTLYMMLDKYFPDKNIYQAFMADILSNIPNIESADIIYRLQIISNKIKEINTDMVNANEGDLLAFIQNNPAISTLFDEFLAKHGHRSIKEAELRSKPWKRDLPALLTYLKTIMNAPNDLVQGDEKINIKEKVKFVKGLLNPFVVSYVKKAREAVVDREYTKSRMIRMIDLFKDRYVLLAKKMKENNLIPDEDLIYFFTQEEIGRYLHGESSLLNKALDRRETFKYQEELVFDDVYIGRPIPNKPVQEDSSNGIKGVPISIGTVRGKVKIVNTIEDANKLEKGDIMVAKFTDIGWSPYYSKISGLITEIGSSLSHGAVVAREYGLPTIVNVKGATRLFKNGQIIEMNASTGIIIII